MEHRLFALRRWLCMKHRKQFLKALIRHLILGIILAAYRDFEKRVSYVDEKHPSVEQIRNAVLERIGKFTKSEIMELVSSIGKASLENTLKKLTEEGFI